MRVVAILSKEESLNLIKKRKLKNNLCCDLSENTINTLKKFNKLEYGFSNNLVVAIYSVYGEKTLEEIYDNIPGIFNIEEGMFVIEFNVNTLQLFEMDMELLTLMDLKSTPDNCSPNKIYLCTIPILNINDITNFMLVNDKWELEVCKNKSIEQILKADF